MFTLYLSKGSSALAPHILLTEVGAPHQIVEVSIPKGAHQTPAFLARNPKGRVPVLDTPDGVLSENPAILEYIAEMYPEAGLLPKGTFAKAQARSLSAYLCATAHIAFAHKLRGRRWADEEGSLADMQQRVPGNLAECATVLDNSLALSPWALGDSYSYCDAYLFLMHRWMAAAGVNTGDYPKLAAHKAAMLARPATQTVLALHDLA